MLITLKAYRSARLYIFGYVRNPLTSCFLSVVPAVQEDAEQGAVPFVRDESLREPGVRIHLHYLSR